jgi:hypothetical protein
MSVALHKTEECITDKHCAMLAPEALMFAWKSHIIHFTPLYARDAQFSRQDTAASRKSHAAKCRSYVVISRLSSATTRRARRANPPRLSNAHRTFAFSDRGEYTSEVVIDACSNSSTERRSGAEDELDGEFGRVWNGAETSKNTATCVRKSVSRTVARYHIICSTWSLIDVGASCIRRSHKT